MADFKISDYIDNDNGEAVTEDKGVIKFVINKGNDEKPEDGHEVEAHYTGYLKDGTVFDSSRDRNQTFKFVIGQGQVIKGWEVGFASMSKGEEAVLKLESDYGYGSSGSPPKIPGGATLYFHVELINFGEKKKEKWDMTSEERITEATELKAKGNELLKAQDAVQALAVYEEGLDYVNYLTDTTDEEKKQGDEIKMSLLLNAAQAGLKADNYQVCIKHTTEVLKEDPKNVKALFRRGVAYSNSGEFKKAYDDLKAAYEVDNTNKAVIKEIRKVKEKSAQAKKKEKEIYKNLFSK